MTTTKKEKQDCCCNPSEDVNTNKLKILAIHGYRQNAETFRQKTGSFRKMLHKWVQFTYITAPHKVTVVTDPNDDLDIQQSSDDEQYGWFFNRDDFTYRGIRKGGPALGFEESLEFIEEIFKEHGPFDGIFGFSQGACFVGLLCDLQQRGLIKIKFNFAIMMSGFKSGCLPHMKYYGESINLPSLHVFGDNDRIIPTEMSEDLRDVFEKSITVRHSGGHYVPATSEQKHQYQMFIKKYFIEKQHTNKEATTMDI